VREGRSNEAGRRLLDVLSAFALGCSCSIPTHYVQPDSLTHTLMVGARVVQSWACCCQAIIECDDRFGQVRFVVTSSDRDVRDSSQIVRHLIH
jgi:hypothetical protein